MRLTHFRDPYGPGKAGSKEDWHARHKDERARIEPALLLGSPPRLRGETLGKREAETLDDYACRVGRSLDESVLAIQGPPGAGKTHTAARMILALVAAGKKVGVTAVSHKVIRNLLCKVHELAPKGTRIKSVQKVGERSADSGPIEEVEANGEVLDRLARGEAQIAGGTAWLWARPDFAGSVDVLFVDEAGQMCLPNVLAVAQAPRSLVLVGDPQQLEQPQQGTHPEGTEVSALEHLLRGSQTVPEDRGIFLGQTWRLPPAICAFTSELFYEGRLQPRPGREKQSLRGTPPFEDAGLWFVPVPHEGNQNSSPEEVEVVGRIADRLLAAGATWVEHNGKASALVPENILVVAPYNAQVSRLSELLEPKGIRVGTVDRFQGQEAPVVIYSMATSTPEDAPRGMEFLYSANRLNVATSRARCACILVASPRLFEPECKTPRQIQLANAFCRYLEMAKVFDPSKGQ